MTSISDDARRKLPKMDKILAWPEVAALAHLTTHTGLKSAVRRALDQLRQQLAEAPDRTITPEQIYERVRLVILQA